MKVAIVNFNNGNFFYTVLNNNKEMETLVILEGAKATPNRWEWCQPVGAEGGTPRLLTEGEAPEGLPQFAPGDWRRATMATDAVAIKFMEAHCGLPRYHGEESDVGRKAAEELNLGRWCLSTSTSDWHRNDAEREAFGHPFHGLMTMGEEKAFYQAVADRIVRSEAEGREAGRRLIGDLQFERARRLGGAFGHLWAGVVPAEHPLGKGQRWTVDLVVSLVSISERDSHLPGGICAPSWDYGRSLSHTTGSGRLTWRIESNGKVEFAITRPGERPYVVLDAEVGVDGNVHVGTVESQQGRCPRALPGYRWASEGQDGHEARHLYSLYEALTAIAPREVVDAAFTAAGLGLEFLLPEPAPATTEATDEVDA